MGEQQAPQKVPLQKMPPPHHVASLHVSPHHVLRNCASWPVELGVIAIFAAAQVVALVDMNAHVPAMGIAVLGLASLLLGVADKQGLYLVHESFTRFVVISLQLESQAHFISFQFNSFLFVFC